MTTGTRVRVNVPGHAINGLLGTVEASKWAGEDEFAVRLDNPPASVGEGVELIEALIELAREIDPEAASAHFDGFEVDPAVHYLSTSQIEEV